MPKLHIFNAAWKPFAGCPVNIRNQDTYANNQGIVDLSDEVGTSVRIIMINGTPYTLTKEMLQKNTTIMCELKKRRREAIQVLNNSSL